MPDLLTTANLEISSAIVGWIYFVVVGGASYQYQITRVGVNKGTSVKAFERKLGGTIIADWMQNLMRRPIRKRRRIGDDQQ